MQRPPTSKPRGLCRYYKDPRGCYAADNCKFLHADALPGPSDPPLLTPYDKSKRCKFYDQGYCKRGTECWFLHVDDDKPNDEEDEPLCSICFEKPITYGLLIECSHIFCIECIKQWRDPSGKPPDTISSGSIKSCPMCRTLSTSIVPSSRFYPHKSEQRERIIRQYRESTARVDCRYFQKSLARNPDRPLCPFGSECMYRHRTADGTLVELQDKAVVAMRRYHASMDNSRNYNSDYFWSQVYRDTIPDVSAAIQRHVDELRRQVAAETALADPDSELLDSIDAIGPGMEEATRRTQVAMQTMEIISDALRNAGRQGLDMQSVMAQFQRIRDELVQNDEQLGDAAPEVDLDEQLDTRRRVSGTRAMRYVQDLGGLADAMLASINGVLDGDEDAGNIVVAGEEVRALGIFDAAQELLPAYVPGSAHNNAQADPSEPASTSTNNTSTNTNTARRTGPRANANTNANTNPSPNPNPNAPPNAPRLRHLAAFRTGYRGEPLMRHLPPFIVNGAFAPSEDMIFDRAFFTSEPTSEPTFPTLNPQPLPLRNANANRNTAANANAHTATANPNSTTNQSTSISIELGMLLASASTVVSLAHDALRAERRAQDVLARAGTGTPAVEVALGVGLGVGVGAGGGGGVGAEARRLLNEARTVLPVLRAELGATRARLVAMRGRLETGTGTGTGTGEEADVRESRRRLIDGRIDAVDGALLEMRDVELAAQRAGGANVSANANTSTGAVEEESDDDMPALRSVSDSSDEDEDDELDGVDEDERIFVTHTQTHIPGRPRRHSYSHPARTPAEESDEESGDDDDDDEMPALRSVSSSSSSEDEGEDNNEREYGDEDAEGVDDPDLHRLDPDEIDPFWRAFMALAQELGATETGAGMGAGPGTRGARPGGPGAPGAPPNAAANGPGSNGTTNGGVDSPRFSTVVDRTASGAASGLGSGRTPAPPVAVPATAAAPAETDVNTALAVDGRVLVRPSSPSGPSSADTALPGAAPPTSTVTSTATSTSTPSSTLPSTAPPSSNLNSTPQPHRASNATANAKPNPKPTPARRTSGDFTTDGRGRVISIGGGGSSREGLYWPAEAPSSLDPDVSSAAGSPEDAQPHPEEATEAAEAAVDGTEEHQYDDPPLAEFSPIILPPPVMPTPVAVRKVSEFTTDGRGRVISVDSTAVDAATITTSTTAAANGHSATGVGADATPASAAEAESSPASATAGPGAGLFGWFGSFF